MTQFNQFYSQTGAHSKKDGKRDDGRRSRSRWCCIGIGWSCWTWSGACIEKVGFIPFIHHHQSFSLLTFHVINIHYYARSICYYVSVSFSAKKQIKFVVRFCLFFGYQIEYFQIVNVNDL